VGEKQNWCKQLYFAGRVDVIFPEGVEDIAHKTKKNIDPCRRSSTKIKTNLDT
jgi:hypothetical protein